MAKVGAQRASELTGVSKSTIQRAMNGGKLSYEVDNNGRRMIDVSELERAFGLKNAAGAPTSGALSVSVEQELEKASSLLETERLKMRIRMLETQLETLETQLDDIKAQRDQWQRQASQVLITSQYSQKQAEELAAELKERERRARERRAKAEQHQLETKMKRMAAQNENTQAQTEDEASAAFTFSKLWKRVKG